MKTTIYEDSAGNPSVTIEGEQAPEAVAREYIKVVEILRPKVAREESAKGTPTKEVKKNE